MPQALLLPTALGQRFTSTVLASHGVVSLSPPSDAALVASSAALAAEQGAKASTGVWGEIRSEVYRELVLVGDKANLRLPRLHGQVESEARARLGIMGGVKQAKL